MLNTHDSMREGTNERTPQPNTLPLFYYVVAQKIIGIFNAFQILIL